MTQRITHDAAKKETAAQAPISKSKTSDVAQVTVPTSDTKIDAKIADSKKESVAKTDSKKDDVKKDDVKKEEVKKDDGKKEAPKAPLGQIGPTLEELAAQQQPTVIEQHAKAAKKQPAAVSATPEGKKEEATSPARLEEIAAQERLLQQVQTNSYRVEPSLGPQSLYHPSATAANPANIYRPSTANAPYSANPAQQQLPQRGGVVTQYEHADLTRTFGRSAADELRDRMDSRLTGDRGLQRMYNKNKDF